MKDVKDMLRPELSLLHLDQSWKASKQEDDTLTFVFPFPSDGGETPGASGRLEAGGTDEGWENGRSQGLCQGF